MIEPNAADSSAGRCFAHCHMTAAEFGFWSVCKAFAHKSGVLYFNGRALAERFESMARSTAYNLADALCLKGWFVEVKGPERRGNGRFSPRHYRVLGHEQWALAHPGECHKPVQNPTLDESEPVHSDYSPVQLQDSPVHSDYSPVQLQGHNLALTYTNPTDLKTDRLSPVQSADMSLSRPPKTHSGRQSESEASHIPAQPVPDFGPGVSDTHSEDVNRDSAWLASAITGTLSLDTASDLNTWTGAVKRLLALGHSREHVKDVFNFAYDHLGARSVIHEGAGGFENHFQQIAAAMAKTQGEPTQ